MKVRQGFVSNSSSTSFCIYGKYLESNDVKDIITKHKGDTDNVYSEDMSGLLLELNLNLDIYYPQSDYGDIYVGRSFSEINDNETGKQFKDSVISDLKVLTKDNSVSARIIEEGYYDG